MKKYFLLIYLSFFLIKKNCYAQLNAIDSLKNIINSEINKPEIICSALLALGDIYFSENKIAEALDCYNKSLTIGEKTKNISTQALSLNNIAIIYSRNGNLNKCIKTLENGLALSLQLRDSSNLPSLYLNLGFFYNQNNNQKKALDYLTISLKISQNINNNDAQAYALANMGSIYTKQKEFEKAETSLKNSLTIREKIGDKKVLSETLTLLAKLYYEKKQYSLALKMANQSLTFSKETNSLFHIRDAAEISYKINKVNKNTAIALSDYELYTQMKDSLSNAKSRKLSIQKELQIIYDKKLIADSIKQTEQNKVKDAQILMQKSQLKQEKIVRLSLFVGAFLILLFAIFIYTRFKITQKQKIVIEKQKALIEEKQKEIIDSIHYAKRIQNSLLPNETKINKVLSKSYNKKNN